MNSIDLKLVQKIRDSEDLNHPAAKIIPPKKIIKKKTKENWVATKQIISLKSFYLIFEISIFTETKWRIGDTIF